VDTRGTPALAIDHHCGLLAAVLAGDFFFGGQALHRGDNIPHILPDSTATPGTLIHQPDHPVESYE
jgi:hypothetical protein